MCDNFQQSGVVIYPAEIEILFLAHNLHGKSSTVNQKGSIPSPPKSETARKGRG